MRGLPALVAAGLVVLGSIAAAVVATSPFGFMGGAGGGANALTEGLASSTPTPDSAGGTVVATIPVGDYPFGVAHDRANGYIYVANLYSNSLSLISGTTVVATVPVGNQ